MKLLSRSRPAALVAAAGLALLLLPGLPAAWFAARDAALDGRVLAAAENPGLLSPAGQAVPLACRLYLTRDEIASGYEARPATAAELDAFATAFAAFCEAGALPADAGESFDSPIAAAEPAALQIVTHDRGLSTWTLNAPDGACYLEMDWPADGDDGPVRLAGRCGAAAFDLDAAADAFGTALGLDALDDWQTLAVHPTHGALLARYSADGQLYLHASFDAGYFSLGVSSVAAEDAAG